MTRLRTDQACLEAQMQQQVAQQLTAELAVPCPDCGVEAGRSCRDSFDRAVRPHLARAVAANRRDTEPCPGPSMLERGLETESFRALQECGAQPQYDSCKECGQTIWAVTESMLGYAMELCGDCCAAHNKGLGDGPENALDERIRDAQAQPDEPHECAWSTPTSEGEGWT